MRTRVVSPTVAGLHPFAASRIGKTPLRYAPMWANDRTGAGVDWAEVHVRTPMKDVRTQPE
jgi:hypothetical protein